MTDYDEMMKCSKCGGKNKVIPVAHDEGYVCETETECQECGYKDYWAYGFFEGGEDEDDGIGECGMLPDGTCMLAGTEHCDFDCKYRYED
jgi:DNA-directed RNA polymerase subunit RPC12/RpoP